MRKNSLNYSQEGLLRARGLRRSMSVGEKWLWSQVRRKQLGFLFKRQVPVGPYTLDFYCPEAALNVELDGEQHEQTVQRDRSRDRFLKERGIETLRIPSLDLFDASRPDCGKWPDRIKKLCEERTGRFAFELERILHEKGLL
jgi:very-short-patch-repair endonuclease